MASNVNRTLYVGNLSERVTEELIYELFLQAGPLESVRIPVQNGRRRHYGFVIFKQEVSVPYAANLFNLTCLFGRTLKLQFTRLQGHVQMEDNMMQMHSNPVMSRLGPPILIGDNNPKQILLLPPPTTPQTLPPPPPPPPLVPGHRNYYNYMPQKRTATHLMPSTPSRKKTRDEMIDKHKIPDSLNFQGLIGNEDITKYKNEDLQDLRSKIKKKKKKKNKEGKEHTRQSDNAEEDKGLTARAGSECHYPQKSFIRNAVNHLKNYSRNHKGSYEISSKHKVPRHIRYDT